jgi:hypothetical protein
MWLMLGKLWCWLTGTHQCLAHYSFSTYFRHSSWYWIVQDVSSSGLITIALSHILMDRKFLKGSRRFAEIRFLPDRGYSSGLYLDSFCRANFTAQNKSSFHWDFFLAEACITPSMWANISLFTVITWWNVTECLLDIHRVQFRNGFKPCQTYFTTVHSSWVVNCGQYWVYFRFWSHSDVNSRNR